MNNSHLCICCFIINISTDTSQCPLCWVLGEGLHEVIHCLQFNDPQVDSCFPIRAILPPPQAYFSSSLPHLHKEQPILPEAWIRVLASSLVPPPQNSITSRPGKLHQFSSGLLPSSPNRLPCFCPLCHFYFPDRSQAMLLRGKSDYVTLLDLHQWFPVSHGAKTQMLTAPGRLPKSWIHPPSPAPRNLLDQIFYCSQSCSRYAAATLAF